jgi:hypothetical protein
LKAEPTEFVNKLGMNEKEGAFKENTKVLGLNSWKDCVTINKLGKL